eukprot:GCRY01002170.1.p1 GENE.GCRY01002170.1~~GCRY01002170.1.p1  ORF type:complete len:239 (-),score=51.80 GCRY01002170.1:107-823(-)
MEQRKADLAEISKYRVAELKLFLSQRSLPTQGNKKDLVDRLKTALLEESSQEAKEVPATTEPEAVAEPEPAAVNASCAPAEGVAVVSDSPNVKNTQNLSDAERLKLRAEKFGLPVVSTLSDEERKKRRAEKFGLPLTNALSEEEKKKMRAQKFGLPATPLNDMGKKKQRAERFGVPLQVTDKQKMENRAKRFSTGANAAPSTKKLKMSEADQEKMAKRKARFSGADQEKMEARKKRFG